ncbi:MAG: phosphatase PAP2 family protein [Bdellovibrio bacteriovorus]
MASSLLGDLRQDLSQALGAGAALTPREPPGGSAWLALWAWSCLVAGLSLLLACGYEGGFTRLNGWASGHPPWVWQWLTALGDERVPFALSLFIARHRPRIFWALVLGALAATAYSRGLKPLFDLPRPPAVLTLDQINVIGPALRRSSFPSGHSVTAGLFFGVLVYYARRPEIRALFVTIALFAGLSRVAVGVHWPVDVAFGLLGGVLAAWAGGRLAARWSGPIANPSIHLALVTLASFFTLTLIYSDRGYGLARPLLTTLGWSALLYAALVYGLGSLISARRRRRA